MPLWRYSKWIRWKDALSQFKYTLNALEQLICKSDPGFTKETVNQLDEAHELNKLLIDKVCALENKLPKGLHIVYPNE